MRRDAQEALQRLERELLEQEDTYEEALPPEAETDELEQTAVFSGMDRTLKVYNTDKLDVDMEDFAEEVYQGSRRSVLPWVLVGLTVALLVLLYLYLKQRGYLA